LEQQESNMKICLMMVMTLLEFFIGSTAFPTSKYNFPQVAIGSFGTGGFHTSFVFFNNQTTTANVSLSLTDDAGNPMIVTLPGLGTNSTFTFALESGESRIYQTDLAGSHGPLKTGAAVAASDAPIGVSAIFTIVDPQGNFVTETGIGHSEPLTEFVIPVQSIGNYSTGLALFNPNAQDSSYTAILIDKDGSELLRTTRILAAGNHLSIYVAGDLFPAVASVEGILTIQSSIPISAITLRQNASPLSYTSCPVVSKSSTQTTVHLAQVVNGTYPEQSYRTSFLLFNISASTANVSISLTRDDGTPFAVAIPGLATNSTFNFTIEAGKSLFLQTDGTGAVDKGGATIISNVPIGATGIFTVYDGDGNFVTETGITGSPILTDFTLPVVYSGQMDTGIALFNPGASTVTATIRFLSSEGENFETTKQITLISKGHSASFFSQIFTEAGNVQGSLAISVPGGVAPLTMRMNFIPYNAASLPVVSGSSPGRSLGPVTGDPRPSSLYGFGVTSDVVLNKTLPPGYHLSGNVNGLVFPQSVTAKSGSNTYTGNVSYSLPASSYDIVLPMGIHTVKATVLAATSGTSSGTLIYYTYPAPVSVSKNTTLDLNIMLPAFFSVSGSISGANKIPGSSLPFRLSMVSADNTIMGYCNVTNGNYNTSLPAGDYTAGLMASGVPSGGLNEDLGIFNIGTIHVSGNTTQDLAIPDLTVLSGAASFLGGIPVEATISATDTSSASDLSLISRTTLLTISSGFTGSYQMLLAKDRAYSMNFSYPLSGGNVLFPLIASAVNPTGENACNFTIPALPAEVQISGKVVDNTGKGIQDVTVAATANSLIHASDTGFATTATTDADGNYSIKVLSGKYQLTFTPSNDR
jgi:hypothetical protein